jgi:hypothetical protein
MEFNFSQLVILALLIEAVVTTIAWVVDSGFNWQRLTALLVAVVMAVLSRIDLFIIVGLPLSFDFVGSVFTGLIIARGANALNDLFSAFKTVGSITKAFSGLLHNPPEEEDAF